MAILSVYRICHWNRRMRKWGCGGTVWCCLHQTANSDDSRNLLSAPLWGEIWQQRCHSVWPREYLICRWNPQNSSHGTSLYMGAPVVLMMGLRQAPALWILWSLYNSSGLNPCGHSCSAKSSGNEDPLKRRAVFHSTDCSGQFLIWWIIQQGHDFLYVVHSVKDHHSITLVWWQDCEINIILQCLECPLFGST